MTTSKTITSPFEQRILNAVHGLDNGDPIKDFLTDDDIDRAIKMLADVFIVTGVVLPKRKITKQ